MSIPHNLSVIRLPERNLPTLSELREMMLAVKTQYVMVIGPKDSVEIDGPISGDIAYVTSILRTRRAIRQVREALPYDPVLLRQINFIGRPIVNKHFVHLLPSAADDPWHSLALAAQALDAKFVSISGSHSIIEPWPRPVRGLLWGEFKTSFDPHASAANAINGRPYPTTEAYLNESFRVYHRNCGDAFLKDLIEEGVILESMPVFDWDKIKNSKEFLVGWMDGVEESFKTSPASWMKRSMIPETRYVSPGLTENFRIQSLSYGHHWFECGIYPGFDTRAWFVRRESIWRDPPTAGHTSSYVTLKTL